MTAEYHRPTTDLKDTLVRAALWIFPMAILALAALLVYELLGLSVEARAKFGWAFLSSKEWDPSIEDFGALPYIYGTVVTSVLALVFSLPLGLGAAIFLSELAPRGIADAITFIIQLLAAVPSVIYGLLATFLMVPLLRSTINPFLKQYLGFLPIFSGPSYGVSFLAAGLILAIMVLPLIISISREALLTVPADQREAALALGATKWEATWQVVVPYARLGITGSVFLALARALGETMAVTMVIGNTPQISESLLAPGYSIAAVIANEFGEANGLHLSALITLGLVLLGLTVLINGVARLLIAASNRGQGKAR